MNAVDFWHRALERGSEIRAAFLDFISLKTPLNMLSKLDLDSFVLHCLGNYHRNRMQKVYGW